MKKILLYAIFTGTTYLSTFAQSAGPLLLLRRFLGPQSTQQWLGSTGVATMPYTGILNQPEASLYSTIQTPSGQKKSALNPRSLAKNAFSLAQMDPNSPETAADLIIKGAERLDQKRDSHSHYNKQQQQNESRSWYSRAYNSFKNYWSHSRGPSSGTGLLGLTAGALLYKKMQESPTIALAAENPTFSVSFREIMNPSLLKKRIDAMPEEEKPRAAADLVAYLSTYLDGGKWETALSKAINNFPELTSIIVNFLTHHPLYLASYAPEIPRVLDFFYSQKNNPAVAAGIIEIQRTIQNTPELADMPHGEAIINGYNQRFPENPIRVSSRESTAESQLAPDNAYVAAFLGQIDQEPSPGSRLQESESESEEDTNRSQWPEFPEEATFGSRLQE